MKSLKIVVCFIACMMMFTSCLNDLNPKSLGPQAVTSQQVYSTPATYLEGLAKLYASFNLQGSNGDTDITTALTGGDGGATVYTRQLWNWQELSTDEAVIAWTGNADLQNIHQQNWTSTGGYLTCLYTRVMFTISLCNAFIGQSAASADNEVKQYHAEARFLRALSYWYALDLYGNPPFVTEKSPVTGGYTPPQITRVKLYNYIQSELSAIEGDLGAPGFNYGHADQAALWMLQAKLFLNAPVYTGATNTYDSCVIALNKIFAAGNYSLATDYRMNFCADNNTSPEIIFPFTQDGLISQTYGGMDFVVHAAVGGSMNAANFGIASGWGGTRTTSALVGKFSDPSGNTDKRAMFYTSGQTLDIADFTVFTDGYAITKFTNLTYAGGPSPSGAPDFVDTDVPVFRLADAYLMYAEAYLRGSSLATAANALNYVNLVVARAFGNITHNYGSLTAGSAGDLQNILDERARELYWEGHRRTDLIRFGQFSGSAYVWPWKGDIAAGTGTSADGHLNIYPIPASDLVANPNLKQNTGYN